MTSKEQERKALEKIMNIIAGLGEDSYIGKAFEGCFEIASENIENDFFCSMKERADVAEKKIGEYKKIRDQLVEEKENSMNEIKKANVMIANLNKELSRAKKETSVVKNDYINLGDGYKETVAELQSKNNDLENTIAEQQRTIIELKAKLYDMMMAQQ